MYLLSLDKSFVTVQDASVEAAVAIHPGRILKEEFLAPVRLSTEQLAQRLATDAQRLQEVLSEQTSMTAELAVRLARFFGTSSDFWMELQSRYDLALARIDMAESLAAIQPFGS